MAFCFQVCHVLILCENWPAKLFVPPFVLPVHSSLTFSVLDHELSSNLSFTPYLCLIPDVLDLDPCYPQFPVSVLFLPLSLIALFMQYSMCEQCVWVLLLVCLDRLSRLQVFNVAIEIIWLRSYLSVTSRQISHQFLSTMEMSYSTESIYFKSVCSERGISPLCHFIRLLSFPR